MFEHVVVLLSKGQRGEVARRLSRLMRCMELESDTYHIQMQIA